MIFEHSESATVSFISCNIVNESLSCKGTFVFVLCMLQQLIVISKLAAGVCKTSDVSLCFLYVEYLLMLLGTLQ